MRNSLLTILVFLSSSLMAQMAFDADNVPQVGEQKLYYLLDETTPSQAGNAGMSSVWDFSGATSTLGETTLGKVVKAEDAGHGGSFPTSDAALVFDGIMSVFTTSDNSSMFSDGSIFYGFNSGDVIGIYDSPTKMYDFSFGFPATNTENISGIVNVVGSNPTSGSINSGTMTNSVDGTGNLTLSNVSYSNVVRLKQTITAQMTAIFPGLGATPVDLISEQYLYYNFSVSNLPLFVYADVEFTIDFPPIAGGPMTETLTYVLSTDNPNATNSGPYQFTSANAPQIGQEQEMFLIKNSSASDLAGVTGAGVTWDYTGIVSESGIKKDFSISAATSPEYPQASLALEYEDFAAMYISQNSYGYQVHGIEGESEVEGEGKTIMSTPTQVFNFPFGYGSGKYVSGFAGTADFDDGDGTSVTEAPMVGVLYSEIDGYGTLNLPNTTYTDIIRYKLIDTVFVEVPPAINPNNGLQIATQYGYFDLSGTEPVLVFSHSHTIFKWEGAATNNREETRVFSIDDPDTSTPVDPDDCTATAPIIQSDVIGKTTASFTWNAVQDVEQFQIRYKKQGAAVNWNYVYVPGNSTSVTLTGLYPEIDYYISIRSKCDGSANYGNWMPIDVTPATDQGKFSTLPLDPCDHAPASITINGITMTSAVANWTSVNDVSGYNLRYKVAGASTPWIYADLGSAETSYALTNLSVNTTYNVQMRTKCTGDNEYSIVWGAVEQFTTDNFGGCNEPPFLSNNQVTAKKALIEWTPIPGAAEYDIRYKKAQVGGWMHVFVDGAESSVWLTGLATGVSYFVQASSRCEGSNIFGSRNPAIIVTPVAGSGLAKFEDEITSDEVKVNDEISVINEMEVVMYPNPTSGVLNIDVVLNDMIETGDVQVHVYDMSGRMVNNTSSHVNNGLNNVRLNLGELTSGLYNVVLYKDGVAIHRGKVQKQ